MKKTLVLALTAFSLTALPLAYAGDKAAKPGHKCEHCEGKTCKHKKKGKKHDCKDCAECSAHKKNEGADSDQNQDVPAAAPSEASH